MRYTLITLTGKILQFYILDCAMVYQRIFGGVIIDEAILATGELAKELDSCTLDGVPIDEDDY